MSRMVNRLRSRNETTYGTLMLVFGVVIWAAILLAVVAAFASGNPYVKKVVELYLGYAIALALFYLISSACYRASAFGNMVLLGPRQFPELHAMVVEGAERIGLAEPPQAFLFNSNGIINAYARRLLGGRYVFLTSALVEANSDQQVRFVIGHELGHHAAGHLNPWKNFIKLPAYAVPFLQPAYSRSREYTCDSIGAYLSQDLEASRSALQMLGCGCRRLNQTMSCEAFMAQEALMPPMFGFLTEIFRSHPRLTRRVSALKARVETNG